MNARMKQIWLSARFRDLWEGRDPFDEVERLNGEVFRQVKSRRTIRVVLDGQAYFAKIHHGVGWREIFKNLLQLKRPVVSAQNEWRALNLLTLAGVRTMTATAFGCKGIDPARIRSFLITEELTGTTSLEDVCAKWPQRPPAFALRKALCEQIASMVRRMHARGVNHRDCYLCHFHLDTRSRPSQMEPEALRLYVIDLHRAQIRRRTPCRWRIKDLAGLYFSALDIGLTRTDCLRFIRVYDGAPLNRAPWYRRWFWWRVRQTGQALYRKLSHE